MALMLLIVGTTLIYKSNIIQNSITGQATLEENKSYSYSYTKAICDDKNYCQDYEIICEGEILIEKNPITGAVIQHLPEWTDPRTEEAAKGFCNISNI